jgi:AraC-like DNA-binding protein
MACTTFLFIVRSLVVFSRVISRMGRRCHDKRLNYNASDSKISADLRYQIFHLYRRVVQTGGKNFSYSYVRNNLVRSIS